MDLATIIAIIALIATLTFAIGYLVYTKRAGAKCIGCPVEGGCPMGIDCGTQVRKAATSTQVMLGTPQITSTSPTCNCGQN